MLQNFSAEINTLMMMIPWEVDTKTIPALLYNFIELERSSQFINQVNGKWREVQRNKNKWRLNEL